MTNIKFNIGDEVYYAERDGVMPDRRTIKCSIVTSMNIGMSKCGTKENIIYQVEEGGRDYHIPEDLLVHKSEGKELLRKKYVMFKIKEETKILKSIEESIKIKKKSINYCDKLVDNEHRINKANIKNISKAKRRRKYQIHSVDIVCFLVCYILLLLSLLLLFFAVTVDIELLAAGLAFSIIFLVLTLLE